MLKKRWLAVVAICLSIFLILALVKFFQIRAAIAFGESFPEPSETVEFQSIAYSTWQPQIKVSGEVRAPQEIELRNEVAGVIAKIGFKSGSLIKKGQLLIQLDIAEEQAQLSALEPQIELAEQDFKRLSGIKNKQAVSQQLIDQARSQRGVVKGQAASIKESIANKTIVAPFGGNSGLHDFEVGEYIEADTLISWLVGNTDELWVDFKLPQQHGKIEAGQAITAAAPELFEGQRVGQVSVVEPAFSRTTRSLAVRAVIANQDKAITPGSFVTVSAPTGPEQTIIRLPSTAVRFDSFGSYVFLLEQQSQQWRAKRKSVTVLAKEQYQTILKTDLSEGMVVATVGAYKLREDLLVKLSGDGSVSTDAEQVNHQSTADNLATTAEVGPSELPQPLTSSVETIEPASDEPGANLKLELKPEFDAATTVIEAQIDSEASTSE
ncbi:MAG: efflux RND transporter periplasmic adaptor subunit [Arenicella sp.]|nr:efflux RND transporter periplasmic adaptor subunit [Arenicella sp.]